MQNTLQNRQQRAALVQWAANDNYTHAFTLNTDRELSLAQIRGIFGDFCHRFDKRVFGTRNVRLLPMDMRLRAIAFPENLTTNAHLHGLADLSPALAVFGNEWRLKREFERNWLQCTRGSGSVHLQAEPDEGWPHYCTKHFDGTYFLAADFHPH
ncbi:MAG: hypothetical protein KatS3mg120_0904 [Erythrobacter sp.]|nr:MAG: hypothetical protein KatS3mg120_0904 [Erythrobacter sp.]